MVAKHKPHSMLGIIKRNFSGIEAGYLYYIIKILVSILFGVR